MGKERHLSIFSNIGEFFSQRDDRKAARNLKLVKNAKAIREDRAAAIDYFKDLKDPSVAVPALLARFEYSLEHGINDTREKESAMDGIVKHGEAALPLVSAHLAQTTRIAWPIKVLTKLGREDQVVETLKGALNYSDVSFDQAIVDKNYDILCYLRDFKIPGFAATVGHFLKDPDERVRFACIELLIEQDDEAIAEMIEPYMMDASAENTRLRQASIEAFLRRKWRVKHRELFPDNKVVEGLFVGPQGQLEIRRP